MNYRHSYHAGNFADVVKHSTLSLILLHLLKKDTPFRYLDTHAGIGAYDLAAIEPNKTGEWKGGAGALWDLKLSAEVEALLAPWRQAVKALNPDGRLRFYPGSPEIVRALARPQDRMTLCELHPEDAGELKRRYRRNDAVSVVEIDGYTALNAYVPPKERRGLVLIDPPFEEPNEFGRMAAALQKAHAKWPTGIYALWYPIKDVRETDAFLAGLGKSGIPSILAAELWIRRPSDPGLLNGSGLAVVNPPWTLEKDLNVLLPGLAPALGSGNHARGRVLRVADEA